MNLSASRMSSIATLLVRTLVLSLLTVAPISFSQSASADVATATPANANAADANSCDQNAYGILGVKVTKLGNECIVQFTVPQTYTWTVPYGITKINRLLIVGGGGAGGARSGAGGGAGGYISRSDSESNAISVIPGSVINVVVGKGAAETSYTGDRGDPSYITYSGKTITANGGGGGGAGSSTRSGTTGGSGGGSMGTTNYVVNIGAGSTQPTSGDSKGLGNPGAAGTGPLNATEPSYDAYVGGLWKPSTQFPTYAPAGGAAFPSWMGGGGGGAGGPGTSPTIIGNNANIDSNVYSAGGGGAGILNNITGTDICYAAGGGGGASERGTGATGNFMLIGSNPPTGSNGNTNDYYVLGNNFRKFWGPKTVTDVWSGNSLRPTALAGKKAPGEGGKCGDIVSGGYGGIGLEKGAFAVPNTGSGGGGGGWQAVGRYNIDSGYYYKDWSANSGGGADGTVVFRYTISEPSSSIPSTSATTGLAMLDYDPSDYAAPPTTLTDKSGSGNTGTLVNAPTLVKDKEVSANNPAYFNFNGTNQAITTTTQYPSPGPQTFSVAVWFRTNALGVSKIMGYENTQAVTGGTAYDRQLYVGNDHKLYWGLCDTTYTSYCPRTVHTLDNVNDNQWHLAIATQSTVGGVATISLSVDNGTAYVSSTGGLAQIYAGYWKIGAYRLNSWPAVPQVESYFKGDLGRITIYNTALNAVQASKIFNDRYSATNVTATPSLDSAGKINLTWPAPAGSPSYVVKVYNAAGTAPVSLTAGSIVVTGNSAVVSNLTPATGYRFTVTTTGATSNYYYGESAKTPIVVAPSGTCTPTRIVSGGYSIVYFSTEGSCQFKMDAVTGPVEYLVVGGGGGGGSNAGYGGQGGYYQTGKFEASDISGKNLAISVGSGGAGGQKLPSGTTMSALRNGVDGRDSAITVSGATSPIVASGGAGGLTEWEPLYCYTSQYIYMQQGFAPVGTSIPGKQGRAGGQGGRAATGPYVAGGAGTNGYLNKAFNLNYTPYYFSSGGGGGGWAAAGGAAGNNGGAGGSASNPGGVGNYFGSGGGSGGSDCMQGGAGAKGVVVLRYLNPLARAASSTLTLPVTGAYAQYIASNYNGLAKVWYDTSSNKRDLRDIKGTPSLTINTAGTVNSRNDFYAVSGTPSDSINIGSLPPTNTIFHVARYSGATKGRIFSATNEGYRSNWLSGFWAGMTGMGYHDAWMTQSGNSITPTNDWLVTADQHVNNADNTFRFNGIDKTTQPYGFNPTGKWGINPTNATYPTENSDFSVAEIIVYDRALSKTEIAQVEDYLTKKYVYQAAPLVGYLAGGGWAPDQLCPSGKVGVGMKFFALSDYGMSQLKMRCGTISTSGKEITESATFAASTPAAIIGGNSGASGKAYDVTCPTNQVLTGLHFVQGAQPSGAAWGQKWPVGMKLSCASLESITASSLSAAYYPTGGTQRDYVDAVTVDSPCGSKQVAVGFAAKPGDITDNLGLICGYPALGQPTGSANAPVDKLKYINVTWDSIPNASNYGIAIYDTSTTPVLLNSIVVDSNTTSTIIDTNSFSAIGDNASYKIGVTALGDGSTFANSFESTLVSVTTTAAPVVPSVTAIGVTGGTVVSGKVTALHGTNLTFTENASITDTGTLSYQWSKNGIVLPAETGTSLTLSDVKSENSGLYSVLVTNTKLGFTATNSASLTLSVYGIDTPTVGLNTLKDIPYSLKLNGYGLSSGTYTLSGTLPAGLKFDTTTGTVYDTPTGIESQTVSVTYSQDTYIDTATFKINVLGTQLNTPIMDTATSTELKKIDLSWFAVDSATSYSVILRNASGELLTTIGLDSIVDTSTSITESNYPDIKNSTTYKVSVIARDNLETSTNGDSNESSPLSVMTLATATASTVETITASGDLNTTSRKSITFTVSPSDGVGTPSYQWQKDGKNLVDETGTALVLTDLTTGDAGVYTVDVTYTKGGINSDVTTSNALTLNVVAGVSIVSPTVGLSASVGVPYSLTLRTSTGTSPFTYALTPGYSLPSGLSLVDTANGIIGGTPDTSTGSFPKYTRVQVSVTDANGSVDTSTPFVITVSASALDSPTVSAAATANILKSIDVSWDAVTNANRYTIYLYSATGSLLTTIPGLTKTTYTITTNDYQDLKDATTYKITVVANDATLANGSSVESTIVSAVTNIGPAVPTFIVNPANASKITGDSFTVSALATAANGKLFYQWQKDGVDIPGASGPAYTSYLISQVNPGDDADYSVVVTNTFNNLTNSATSEVAHLTVNMSIITPSTGLIASTATGSPYSLPILAYGGTLPYTFSKSGALPAGLSLNESTGIISGQASETGDFSITVTATDAASKTKTTNSFTIKVVATAPYAKVLKVVANPTPGILKSIDVNWQKVSNAQNYLVRLWNAAGDSILASVPVNETASANSITITSSDYWNLADGADYMVGVTAVSDETATVANGPESDKVGVTTNNGPATPAIQGFVNPTSGVIGGTASFTVTASRSDSGILTYQWYKGIQKLDGQTSATLRFTSLKTTDAGNYYVKVTNSLNGGFSIVSSNNAKLTVNSAVSINTPTAGLNATQGNPYKLIVPATGGSGSLTYGLGIGTLPTGLVIDATTGTISGTPDSTTAGTDGTGYTISVIATDENGASASTSPFTINVFIPYLTPKPVVTARATTNVLKSIDVDWSSVAVPGATSYTVNLYTSGGAILPTDGLSGVVGTNLVIKTSNYAPLADATTYKVGVVANSDGYSTGKGNSLESLLVSVTTASRSGGGGGGGVVVPPPAPAPIAGPTLNNLTPGTPFNYSPSVPGSTGYTLSGTLPPGLTFNPVTGQISGTPTTSGPYSFSITAAPSGQVINFNGTIPAGSTTPAPITGPSLNNLTPGTPFNYTPSVPGATGYTINGTLPAGLNFNSTTGQISGTPTGTGPYSFSMTAAPSGQVINFSGNLPGTSGTGTTGTGTTPAPVPALAPLIAPTTQIAPVQNGNVAVLTNSNTTPVSVKPNTTNTGLVVTQGGWQLSIAAVSPTGTKLTLNADQQIVATVGNTLASSGTGYLPNSTVLLYLFSTPKLVGTVKTDAKGNYTTKVQIPVGTVIGNHTLQVNGFLKNRQVRSASLALVLKPGKVKKTKKVKKPTKSAVGTDKSVIIPFSTNSSVISDSGITALNNLALKDGAKVLITGYASSANRENGFGISLDRAINAKKALLKINPKLNVSVIGTSGSKKPACADYENMCAVVTVK